MSRQQFLAELTQYLTFVTPYEREQIIAIFEEKFDSVGPEGETSLLMELGTPMSIAIAFKRRKESGELIVPSEENAPESGEIPVVQQPLWSEAPIDEAPVIVEAQEPESESAAELHVEPVSEQDSPTEEEPPEDIPARFSAGDANKPPAEPPAPRKALSAGTAIGAGLLSIISAAILLIPAAAGGYLVAIMLNFVLGALKTMSIVNDALWMFAFGFAAGAVGLVILWFFLWAIIRIIRRLFRGRSVAKSAFMLCLKKVWKVVWTVSVILFVVGIACGAVSFARGGNPNDLFDNAVSVKLFDWFSGNALATLFTDIFG